MAELNNHADRGHAFLSASGAHRWLECPPSALAGSKYPRENSPFAVEGTIAHEVAEAIAGETAAPEELLERPDVTPEMVRHAQDYRDYIHEQIQNPDNAVIMLETEVDFSDIVPGGFGTCDCIIIENRTLHIIDYKYGMGVQVSAENNPQMRLYAIGALHDFGVVVDATDIVMHIFQPRINHISVENITVEDLDAWGKQVKPTAKLAYAGKGKYKAGAHCKFCPHAGKCRTLADQCREVVEHHGVRKNVSKLAPHEVAEILEMEPVISSWLRRVKAAALQELLDGKEIPGYKAVEGRQGNRKWTDEAKVIEALQKAGYKEEDYMEQKLRSPSGIDKAIGKSNAADVIGNLIQREPGQPVLVPDTDSRHIITNSEVLAKDFD